MTKKKLSPWNNNLKFIDLSADFRITDFRIYEKNYKIKHKAKTLINWNPKHSDLFTIIKSTWNIYNQ